jgi:3-oxoacyl-[acyl-carrier protein] reductase
MKTVLITGASRGIGSACAEKFASEGYNVILNCIKSIDTAAKKALELSEKYGVKACAIKADVASEYEVKDLFKKAKESLGAPDILINNAGIANIGLFQDMSSEEWDRLFGVNVKSVFLCCKEAIPHMIANQSGAIINVSSMWGEVGASCEAAYSASKAAVIGYTKALAKELAPSGIRVNCISPGLIDTDMNSTLTEEIKDELCRDIPLQRIGKAEEVAEWIYLVATRGTYVTGQTFSVNGGAVI